jgi:hypothetical protein
MAVSQKLQAREESPTLANHNFSRLQEAQHTKLHIAAYQASYSSNQDQPLEGQQHKQSVENLQAWTNETANQAGSHAAPAIKPQPKQ